MEKWAVGAQLGMQNPERSLYLEVLLGLFCSHPFDVKCGTASCDRVVAKFLAFQRLVMDSMWLMYRLGGWKDVTLPAWREDAIRPSHVRRDLWKPMLQTD